MPNRSIAALLPGLLITALHGALATLLLLMLRQKDWSWQVAACCLPVIVLPGLWIAWTLFASKRFDISRLRAGAVGLIPLALFWVWIGYYAYNFTGAPLRLSGILFKEFLSLVAVAAMSWALLSPGKGPRRKILAVFSALWLIVVFYDISNRLIDPPYPDITVKKLHAVNRGDITAVSDAEKFSNLKVTIGKMTRYAFAMPPNHMVRHPAPFPPGGIFRVAVGIEKGEGGYQFSAFALDRAKKQHRIGVWYITRDKSKWVNIEADVSALGGMDAELMIQAAQWSPDGTKLDADESFLYLSNPRIAPRAQDGRPNVVLILVDTLRADHLTVYGYGKPTSPNIENFARKAIVWDNVVSGSSWTIPSMATLFTGKLPIDHKVGFYPLKPLSADSHTLAEEFQKNGYYTAAIFGNMLMGENIGFGQGFDEFTESPSLIEYWTNNAYKITETTKEFIDSEGLAKPFFLYVHYIDPHDPYWLKNDDSSLPSSLPGWIKPFLGLLQVYELNGLISPSALADVTKYLVERYDMEIEVIDRQIQELLLTLESRGLSDNTIVAITADHGEEFMEHGAFLHGRTLYNECVHVPFMIRFPGDAAEGRRVERPVSGVDIASTILDAAGLQDEAFSGVSLLSTEEFPVATAERPIFTQLFGIREQSAHRAVIWQNKKLIVYETPNGKKTTELYFLDEDPGEKRNRAGDFPDMAQALMTLIGPMNWPKDTGPGDGELNAETIRKLRALGYLK